MVPSTLFVHHGPMARFTVYVPDDLYRDAREQLPDELSWSTVLAEGLRARLECSHDTVVCTRCRATVDTPVRTVEELGAPPTPVRTGDDDG